MTSGRRPIAAGNWKMNLLRRDAADFCRALHSALGTNSSTAGDPAAGTPAAGTPAAGSPVAEILIFPPATLLTTVAQGLEGLPAACGGQDLHPEASGAHTGDISGPQLADAGATWTLCGHSERRQDHGETDELVAAKARAAVEHGLRPMVCLGETEEQREAGITFEVLARQLGTVLDGGLERFELAYEPVWAIGTGKTATPEIAQEAHAFLRSELGRRLGDQRAGAVRILYGGSANPGNAAGLIAQSDIDGFLVGGASLDAEKFLAIIKACGAS